MWDLRVLSGPQAGTVIALKMGQNTIGRSPQCDIKLLSQGVSKEHTVVMVYPDRVIITDKNSSNGTYLNGVRIQSASMRLGDKLGIHDILLDLTPHKEQRIPVAQAAHPAMQGGYAPPPIGGMPGNIPGDMDAAPAYSQGGFKAIQEKFNSYIERVALPGIFKLTELFEFKGVLLGFVVVFIFSTTLLSMLPMVQITRTSILVESKRRAGSIARTVAILNQAALLQNSYSNLSTNSAESEEGVKQVLIVQQSDGMILAPASRAGTTPDLPFVHSARREMRPQAVEINSSTIGVSFPIGLFDPNTGEQSIKAHAIVIYDVGSLAFDDGQAISLFMQTLLIACLVGLLIYYFMYKLIEYPIVKLNAELDSALREKTDNTVVNFNFPPLQALVGNINSLLTRYINGDSGAESGAGGFINKDGEAENIVQIVGYPCVAIAKENRIIAVNSGFLQVAHAEGMKLPGRSVQDIPDGSLQQNITELMRRALETPRMTHVDQLEFGGHLCILSCQAVCTGQEVDYYIVTVSPAEGSS